MSLRERNAALTREHVLDTALALFLDRGYDATTMEEIAEAASIGTSTLYRYFPTKDLLLIAPIALHGQMAAELRGRPGDETLDVALGHAVVALVRSPRTTVSRLRQIFAVLEAAPGPRARLQEDAVKERQLLEAAIAERLGRPADDTFTMMTARTTMALVELIGETSTAALSEDPAEAAQQGIQRACQLVDELAAEPAVLPRFEARGTAAGQRP